MATNQRRDIDWPVITMTNNVTLLALQKKIYTAFKDMRHEHPCACDVSKGFWNSVYPQLTISVWDMTSVKTTGECRVPMTFSVIFRDDNNIEYASFNGPRCIGSIMFTRNGRDMFIHKNSSGCSIELAKFVLSRVRNEIEYQERRFNKMKLFDSDDLRRCYVDPRPSVLMTRNEYEVILNSIDLKDKDLGIKDVIFNNPATIVYWKDGTKTVVKRQKGERWDEEKGLIMAIVKKMMGNKGNYNNLFRKWCPENSQKKHTS